MRSLSIEKHLN
jgi:hypothetical protein